MQSFHLEFIIARCRRTQFDASLRTDLLPLLVPSGNSPAVRRHHGSEARVAARNVETNFSSMSWHESFASDFQQTAVRLPVPDDRLQRGINLEFSHLRLQRIFSLVPNTNAIPREDSFSIRGLNHVRASNRKPRIVRMHHGLP